MENYQQAVTAMPEIYKLPITDDMEFIVMGCDGIWDCVGPQELCDYISSCLRDCIPVKTILRKIFDVCISKLPNGKIFFILSSYRIR